ncbi:DUF169 domain-containing protein [candidate division KSB1 bacterium]|nr:DUF169 domain-containing protein [candidate division KSB1 bacterium]
MELTFKQHFISQWKKYFGDAELPITFYYSDQAESWSNDSGPHCLICDLQRVRRGETHAHSLETLNCAGAKRYVGFAQTIRTNFNYFLSCGIPGVVRGERYKKSPEIVEQAMKNQPPFEAPAKNIVFKRWDKLDESDDPQAVIFFATPDVLAGLFTLVNFNCVETQGVIAPFGAGCASIIYYPYHESLKESPCAVLGMFDVSARPCVKANELTFSLPINRFRQVVEYMDESFLITESWEKVQKRIK